MNTPVIAHPPETLEGWFALHQIFRFSKPKVEPTRLARTVKSAAAVLESAKKTKAPAGQLSSAGWSCVARLIGSTADLMVIHFRDSLEAIGAAQEDLARAQLSEILEPAYTFLSVTEAGLYHLTAELARDAVARGGRVGDEEYARALDQRTKAERSSAHVNRRLYPELPADMPYVSFYPMSKRRESAQNWYTLPLEERSRLMQAHGLTGRRYAGRVQQVITGAIGLDNWEWGVTLFARDPLEFKKLVTDMRFDEVSAKYAEFGDFYVGKIISESSPSQRARRTSGQSGRAR
ncbi:MAG: heme-dependent peroxidase [Gemmatimonadota bacterium]|nr:heme-dependent peroxidase [Gemmatimonadota bacterium]